jgi:hypothetical protein
MTLRALGVGTLAVVVICFVVSYAELVTGQIMIGYLQLPPAVLALLFVLVVLNLLIRRLSARAALSPSELAFVYTMCLLAAMVSSRGLLEDLPVLVGQNYFANPVNNWQNLFFGHIKPWMVPWDPHGGPQQWVALRFYEGLRAGESVPWAMWIRPLLSWGILIALVYFAFLCLATIFRRQWADNERLSFPLVRLPAEMIGNPRAFLLNRLMWVGFAIPMVIYTINGLHNLRPAVPGIRLSYLLNDYMAVEPWKSMSYNPLQISFAGIGFCYLLPSELLLSFWVFYWFGKMQDVIARVFGLDMVSMPHAAAQLHVGYQTVGAFFALAVYLVVIAWPHLRGVLRRAVGQPGPDDRNEMLPYPVAVWGLAGSLIGIVLFCGAIGMSPSAALLEMGLYLFVQGLIMARCTAEAGLLMTEGSWAPIDVYGLAAPKYTLGASSLTGMAFTGAMFTRDLRGIIFTGYLDSAKLADELALRRRNLLLAFAAGLGVAVVVGVIIGLWLPYHRGALNLYPFAYQVNSRQFFDENAPLVRGSRSFYAQARLWAALGAAFTVFLAFMRVRFAWWPLHPLGYAMMASWATIVFWFSMMVAWAVKSVIVRFGGMRLYAAARPLFLGLIFGEFAAAGLWTLLASIWRIPTPTFPWQ